MSIILVLINRKIIYPKLYNEYKKYNTLKQHAKQNKKDNLVYKFLEMSFLFSTTSNN